MLDHPNPNFHIDITSSYAIYRFLPILNFQLGKMTKFDKSRLQILVKVGYFLVRKFGPSPPHLIGALLILNINIIEYFSK